MRFIGNGGECGRGVEEVCLCTCKWLARVWRINVNVVILMEFGMFIRKGFS